MKKRFFIACFVLLGFNSILAQSVAINTDGSSANSTAMLDIKSTTKGLLIPRLTSAQRTAIATPATGLLVFDTNKNSFWYYNGVSWIDLSVNSNGWNITGNGSINPSLNFLGTLDDKPLLLKVNNLPAGIISSASNTAFGYNTLPAITSGTGNTAIGYSALVSDTSGINNTAIGLTSLFKNRTGSNNTAIGHHSLTFNSTGDFNTAIGASALYQATDGAYNVAAGAFALYSNASGAYNTAIGTQSLYTNTNGEFNIAVGYQSMYSNSLGTCNTAIGFQALYNNTNSFNTAIGYSALIHNTTGSNNVAIGVGALSSNTIAENNTAVGINALESNNTGVENTAVGASALLFNTSGGGNTAMGKDCLLNNNSGTANSGFGHGALLNNTIGGDNIAVGTDALFQNTNGNANTAIGFVAMSNNTTGLSNTAVGYAALASINSSNNTAVGYQAGPPPGFNVTNTVTLGFGSLTNVNNLALLGNTTTIQCGGYANWSNFSDGRFKKNVQENVPGLDFIKALRPVTYTVDVRALDQFLYRDKAAEYEQKMASSIAEKESIVQTGFIAQEVEQAAAKLGFNFDGVNKPKDINVSHYSLSYASFVVPMVKAIQEQQTIIEQQQLKIDALEKRLQALEKSNSGKGPVIPKQPLD